VLSVVIGRVGRDEEALGDLLRREPLRREVQHLQAAIAGDRGGLERAVQYFSAAIEIAEAQTVQGRLLNVPGSWIDAEREIRTAIRAGTRR
jgi:Tfp pilus assembly protein PilF